MLWMETSYQFGSSLALCGLCFAFLLDYIPVQKFQFFYNILVCFYYYVFTYVLMTFGMMFESIPIVWIIHSNFTSFKPPLTLFWNSGKQYLITWKGESVLISLASSVSSHASLDQRTTWVHLVYSDHGWLT